MDNKLFVGNLAWATTEDDLKAYFGQFGTVESAEVLRDKFTGRSRGFAFVVFATAEEAQRAIENTDGREFQERPLKVNIARPHEERPPRQGGFRPRFGGDRGYAPRQGGYNRDRGDFNRDRGDYRERGDFRGGYNRGSRQGGFRPRRGGFNNGGTRSFEGGEER